MKKMFSLSLSILMALIALNLHCAYAQDPAVAVDETIASILNDVEAEPTAAIAMESVAAEGTTADLEPVPPEVIVATETTALPEVLVVEVPAEGAKNSVPKLVVTNGSETPESSGTEVVRVSMAFEDAPLPDVIRAFREASGANIISGWTNSASQLVSMRLDNVPWQQGLISILTPYGLQLKEEPRGSSVYVVTEKSTFVARYTQTFELSHAKAEDIAKLLKSTLDASSLTVAFPSANAVVVKATEVQLKECEDIIKILDKPSRQVYIEARFVRLSSSASKKLGMKWDSLANFGASVTGLRGGIQVSDATLNTFDTTATSVSRDKMVSATGVTRDSGYTVNKTTSTLVPEEYTDATISGLTANDLTWKKASGFGGVLSITDFGLTMSAFEEMGGAQIFSNPKIIVENETKAKIDMTTKYPNVNIDYQAATQAGQRDSISSKLAIIPGKSESWVGEAFFSYGITLEVTPRVSPTGLITVEIIPSISSLSETLLIGVEGSENSYPIIKVQRLDTTFTMDDGRTAVIGGLTETTESNIDSGIPLLRNIPWVGPRLFGWKSRQKEQYEIIVFVTVGIIDGTTIEQNAGMPKNSVIGRGLFDGTLKEPGDRTDEEMFNLEQKPSKGYRIK